jgi:AraC-like DNA-binding protein
MASTADNHLRLGRDRALYLGSLPAGRFHRHGAPVLLLGLSGPLTVELRGCAPISCRSALIDAGVEHRLDPGEEHMASLYLEPSAEEVHGIRREYLQAEPASFDIVPKGIRSEWLLGRMLAFDLPGLLGRSIAAGQEVALDARVQRTLAALRSAESRPSRGELAAGVRLSESRFNHLFSEQMGVCFRRYRLWMQLRGLLEQLPRFQSLTDAAVHGGFADSAHFSRSFSEMIGLPPSAILKGLTSFELLD